MNTGLKFAVLGLATSLAGASLPLESAQAAPVASLSYAFDTGGAQPVLEPAQFVRGGYFYAGRNYCWYDSAWSGPGWYWCGYPWRRGYGWGGGYGWRGWGGGRGWHGEHRGWHEGRGDHGWHGGHGEHGEHGGDHHH